MLRTFQVRLRLTLAYAAAMSVVLGLVGWYGYARLAAGLDADLDRELDQRAQDIAGPLSDPQDSLRELAAGGYVERGESFAELVTPGGAVVQATPTLGGARILTPAQAGRAASLRTMVDVPGVPGLDEPARLLAVPFHRNDQRMVLVVGATRENGLEVLRAVRTRLLVAGPALLLASSALAYLLAAGALRPVERMRRRAQGLTGASSGQRLPVPRSRDELARLGGTFNALLDRIDDSVDRERQFLTNASHELRTPLSLLRTELDLASRRPRTAAELQAAVESASHEVDRLISLANDLLVLAREPSAVQPGQRTEIRVRELLDACVQRRTSHERRRLIIDEGGAEIALADEPRLRQALDNLIDNALVHATGSVHLTTVERPGALEVHVTDSGPGLDEGLLGHVFERFTTGGTSRGSGLGLAVVDHLARLNGWRVGIRNLDSGGVDAWIAVEPSASSGFALQAGDQGL